MNLADLPGDTKYITQIRVTAERGGDYPLFLEITTYALNDVGDPYVDSETHEAAKEVKRYRIKSLEVE